MKVYRAHDEKDHHSTWEWWSPDLELVKRVFLKPGRKLLQKRVDPKKLLPLPLDSPDIQEALEDASIDTSGYEYWEPYLDPYTLEPDILPDEIHIILNTPWGRNTLPKLLRQAGYVGVIHPEVHLDLGYEGLAVALIR